MPALTERSGFQGLVTNVAESKAPAGALIEANNVVIRRANCVEPRDGLIFDTRLQTTDLGGFSFAGKDYAYRDVGPYRYRELGAADLTPDIDPMRRDITSRAQARGNLYIPASDGTWRLLPNATAFTPAGLVMTSAISGIVPVAGPSYSGFSTGLTAFSGTTYLEHPAALGPVPAATYWVAVQFYLRAMPNPAVAESLISRGKGTTPTNVGFQLQLFGGNFDFSWKPAGVLFNAVKAIQASDVGRMHLVVFSYTGASGTIWVDGVPGTTTAGAALAADPLDVATWGNGRMWGPQPVQSAVIMAAARGTTALTQAMVDAFYAQTKATGELSAPGTMPASHFWRFSTIPIQAPIGGQIPVLTGPTPYLQEQATLWPGDTYSYPPEYWLPSGYHVAYRLVGYSKDSTGLERRSAPSPQSVVEWTSVTGASAYTEVSIVQVSPPRYDTVEIYRSRVFPIGVQIDDEMQLVGTVPATNVMFVDQVPQESRGATLYTSPSRGGILQQNDPPPAACCVALFKGSLFFGNTRGPASLVYSFTWGDDLTGQPKGVGIRFASGTFTIGSAVITGVSEMAGVEPGQLVSRLSGSGYGHIASVAGSTITLTLPWLDSNGVSDIQIMDQMWFGPNPLDATRAFDPRYPGNVASYLPGTTVTQIVPPLGGHEYTFAIVSSSRSIASAGHVVRASHGGEYTPALPLYGGVPMAFGQDVRPGGIIWSKEDEPEHVPPINYAIVGDLQKSVLGFVATRDALFILKEDGIWRLTGARATWRTDPFDPTTICVFPNSICSFFGRGAFLSRKGVVCVGDAGVELISAQINDLVRAVVDEIQTTFNGSGRYTLANVFGFGAAVFERENEYTLLRGGTRPALVYNQNTGAWTTFDIVGAPATTAIMSFARADRNGYINALGGFLTALSNHVPLAVAINPQYRADRERAVTISSYSFGTGMVTLSANPGTVEDGDILIDSAGLLWIAVGTTTGPTFQVRTVGAGFMGTGAGYLYRSMHCRIVPTAFMDPAATTKHNRSIITAFPVLVGGVNVRQGFQSALNSNWVFEDARVQAPKGYVNLPMGYQNSALVPRAHARSWNLRSALEWSHAFGNARLEAIFCEHTEMLVDSTPQVTP